MSQTRERDISTLLDAARDAIALLRRNAEYLAAASLDSGAEREAVRRLNMAVQVVEFGHQPPDPERYYEG